MGIKLKESASMTNVPGSGAYNPQPTNVLKKNPAFTIAQKYHQKGLGTLLSIPGPGQYEQSLNNKRGAPHYGFGTGQREEQSRKLSVPGPGAYKLKAMVGDVPDYSMPNRDEKTKFV